MEQTATSQVGDRLSTVRVYCDCRCVQKFQLSTRKFAISKFGSEGGQQRDFANTEDFDGQMVSFLLLLLHPQKSYYHIISCPEGESIGVN